MTFDQFEKIAMDVLKETGEAVSGFATTDKDFHEEFDFRFRAKLGIKEEVCVWAEDEDGDWDTDCDEKFVLIEGTPYENGMNFCSFCGKTLMQKENDA